MASNPVTKTIEPALTVFSGAEIRVVSRSDYLKPVIVRGHTCIPPATTRPPLPSLPWVPSVILLVTAHTAICLRQVLLPVGEAPEAAFQRYASLIVQHRQVRQRLGGRSLLLSSNAALPGKHWCCPGLFTATIRCLGSSSSSAYPQVVCLDTASTGGAQQRAVVLQGGAEEPLQVLPLEDRQHALQVPAGEH